MTPEDYTERVVQGKLKDPTLSFQLAQGFEVLAVVSDYFAGDPESQGYAALIQWRPPDAAAQ